jgi:uncharacterized protein
MVDQASNTLEQTYSHHLALPIIARALDLLDRDLAVTLVFHSTLHTCDVIRETMRFALYDGLEEHELLLLAIAAAYHDTGFTQEHSHHEEIGAVLAREAMQSFETYSKEDMNCVETMIRDTRITQTDAGPLRSPNHALSGYLLDADLSNIGRDDFFEHLELFFCESSTPRLMLLKQMEKLLSNHQWFTAGGRYYREEGRKTNLKKLRQAIADIEKKNGGGCCHAS